EAGHAVPAQFHVVVEPAPDQVQVGIIQAGNDGPAPGVDHQRRRPTLAENLIAGAGGKDLAALDRDGLDERRDPVGGDLRVVQNDVGSHGNLLCDAKVATYAVPQP